MKLILNPEFKDAPYEYAFCDEKGENIQRVPEELLVFRFDENMNKVFRYIKVEEEPKGEA